MIDNKYIQQVVNDFNSFAKKSDVILANRFEPILEDVKDMFNKSFLKFILKHVDIL